MEEVRCLEVLVGDTLVSFLVSMEVVRGCALDGVVEGSATGGGVGGKLLGVVDRAGAGAGVV